MAPSPTSYARIADRYEQDRGGDGRAEVLADAVTPWLPDAGLVADIGAGTCVVTRRLATSRRRVVAFDLSAEMLRNGSDRLPGQRAQADASRLPVHDASLDALTFVWVLHHVGDLAAVLAEAGRVLRPTGRVVAVSGVALPTDDEMGSIFEGLNDQLRPGQRARGLAVASVGPEAGLELIHDGLLESTWSVSPNGLADAIEDGLISFVWDLPANNWQRHVEPALDALRSLPEPDRVRDRPLQNPLVVLGRP